MNPSPVSTILKLVSSTSTLSSCTLILLESPESTESTEPPDGVFLSVMAYVVFAPPKPPPPPDPPPSQAFWPDLLMGVSDSDPPDTLNRESVWISSYVPEGTLLAMVQTFTAVCSFSYKSVSVSHEMELLPLPLFQLERQVLDSYPSLMSLAYLDLDVWMLSLVERDIHQLPLQRNLPSFLNDKSANLVLIRSIDNLTLLTGLILHLNCIKHITKLPRIEACVKLPLYEDVVGLPQYEDVVGLPRYEDAMRHNLFSYVFSWLSSFGFSLCCLALSDSGMCFEELISRTSNGAQHGANVLTVFPKAAGFASPRKTVLLQGLLSSCYKFL